MKENKRKKIIAVVSAIFVIVLILSAIIFVFRNSVFALTMPKAYTLKSFCDSVEKIEDEWDKIEDNLFIDEIDFDEDTTLSFWKYTDSDNKDKKGDLSFDLSVSNDNKRLEFAYDNTKAKKIKDMFLYIDNDEIGVNFADFSDDYWVNNAKTVISDYNNSTIREIFNKDEIKKEYDLSFKENIDEELEDKIEKKEVLELFLKTMQFEKKKIVNFKNSEFNMYFSQTKEEMQNFLNVMLPGFENYFEVKDTDIIFSLRNGEVRGVSVDFSPKHSFDLQFFDKKYFLNDFAFSFFTNDGGNKTEIAFMSKGNRFEKKDFSDESELSFTSSLGNKIYLKNSVKFDNNDVVGSFVYGVNNEKTVYDYNGIFDTSDGILLDLSEVKSTDTNSQMGFYLENKFNNVIRKVENKKEIFKLNKNELTSYLRKTGGENFLNLFN